MAEARYTKPIEIKQTPSVISTLRSNLFDSQVAFDSANFDRQVQVFALQGVKVCSESRTAAIPPSSVDRGIVWIVSSIKSFPISETLKAADRNRYRAHDPDNLPIQVGVHPLSPLALAVQAPTSSAVPSEGYLGLLRQGGSRLPQ